MKWQFLTGWRVVVLVEEVQLTFDIVIPFFAGFAKEFLGKKIDLFLENLFAFDMFFFELGIFFISFVGSFEKGIKVLNSSVQFLDGILEFYKLPIP